MERFHQKTRTTQVLDTSNFLVIGGKDDNTVDQVIRIHDFLNSLGITYQEPSPVPPGELELANITSLRAITAAASSETRAYLHGTSSATDGGGSFWNLIASDANYGAGHANGNHDDGAMHVVDADGRLWAREYDMILPQHFGITLSANEPAAESAADQYTAIQKYFDYFIDPFCIAHARQGTNGFVGFSKRPKGDQWGRDAYWPKGLARTDTTIRIETSPADFIPGGLAMQGGVFVKYAAKHAGFALRLGIGVVTKPWNINAVKGYVNISGSYRPAWSQRSFTAAAVGDNATTGCKYPQIDRNANTYFQWVATTKVFQNELIEVIASGSSHGAGNNGSRWLYRATATHTLGGSIPTHTTGTVSNLLCLGMISTPIVGGGGQFDTPAILAAETDAGIIIESCVHNYHEPLLLEGIRFAVGVLGRPDATNGQIFYSQIGVGQCADCKFQCAIVTNYQSGGIGGLINTSNFLMRAFQRGDSYPPSDETMTSFISVGAPTTLNLYQSNHVRVLGVSHENTVRTGNAKIVQANMLHGTKFVFPDMRTDLSTYTTVIFGRNRAGALIPNQNYVKTYQIGEIEYNGAYNIIENYDNDFENPEPISVDFRNFLIQGFNGNAINNGYVYSGDCGGVDLSNGAWYETGWYYPNSRFQASNESWFMGSSPTAGLLFELGFDASGRDIMILDVEPIGNTGLLRCWCIPIDPSNGAGINPQRYPSNNSGADNVNFVMENPTLWYQTSLACLSGSPMAGKQSFGVPSWAQQFHLAFTGTDLKGVRITVRSTRPWRVDRGPSRKGLEYAPEAGVFRIPGEAPMKTPGGAGESKHILNKTFGTNPLVSRKYYATTGQWTNATAYTAGQYVHNGLTGGQGNVYLCLTSGTSNGSSPTNDVGCSWSLQASNVYVVVPADWIKK